MLRRHHRRSVRVDGPLAVAVIGGMVSSTLLTLVVVPAVYSLVEGGLRRLASMGSRVEGLIESR